MASPLCPAPRRPLNIKIVSIGEGGVGKSCLIKRHCEGRFVSKYQPTIGVDYGVKAVRIGGQEVRVSFWDLAGFSSYAGVRVDCYEHIQGALLVFDVTQRRTFDALPTWVREMEEHTSTLPAVVVCGNKTDGDRRSVSEAEARSWAAKQGFLYYDTSAQTGYQVDEALRSLFECSVKLWASSIGESSTRS